MKKHFCLLLAMLLCLNLFCGCTKQEAGLETTMPGDIGETQPTGEELPEAEGFGLAYVPSYGLNPYDCTCLTNRPILSLAYESLFVLNDRFEAEPVLCEKFAVSDDGMTYLFALRQEAKFSDGTAVTAQDVVASLRAAEGSDYYGSRFFHVNSISATDTYTVTLRLDTPYENLPLLLDVPVTKAGTETSEVPIGSGPYTVQLAAKQLIRNAAWWQDGIPAVDRSEISLVETATPAQVRDSFEFGTTSVVCADPNSPAAMGYRCDYELWNEPTTVMQYLGFHTESGLFANQTLRAAVTHLIDRDTIVSRIYSGFATAASLPCAPACGMYDETLAKEYAYDEAAFAAAVRAAGASGSGTILVWSADASRTELAYFIADAFAAYGLTLEVAAVDFDTYQNRLKSGNYDIFIGEVRLSGNFDLSSFFRSGGALSYGGIADERILSLCSKTLENSGSCLDLYRKIMDSGAICPISFKAYAVMATRGSVSSLQPALDCVFHLAGGRTLADAGVSYGELTGTVPAETDVPPEE